MTKMDWNVNLYGVDAIENDYCYALYPWQGSIALYKLPVIPSPGSYWYESCKGDIDSDLSIVYKTENDEFVWYLHPDISKEGKLLDNEENKLIVALLLKL